MIEKSATHLTQHFCFACLHFEEFLVNGGDSHDQVYQDKMTVILR